MIVLPEDAAAFHGHRGVAVMMETAVEAVRRAFEHAAHPGACTSCHTDLHGDDVVKLAVPAKATCASCHEGKTAFKLTGTTCTRCHTR